MFRTLKAPITVQIEVTEGCDNVCRHCYNFFRHTGYKHKSLTLEHVDYLIGEFQKLQVIRGVVTGGEPLTVPETTIYLLSRMKEIGMGILFNSNMTLFNEEMGRKLMDGGVTSIMTSLIADDPAVHDFVTQRPGSWERAAKNIRLAVKMGFRVMVNMVLTKWNYHRLRQTGDLAGTWGVNKFGATRACPPGPIAPQFVKNLISLEELRDSLRILYELQEKWGYNIDVFEHYPWCALGDVKKYHYLARRKCTAGVTSASIGSDGQMRPCGHSAMIYGNVFEEGVQTPWLRMTDWREQKYSPKCQGCQHYRSCTGGCAVDAQNSECGKDHHMTSGDDVISVPDRVALTPVEGDTLFEVLPQTILREEVFGGTVTSREAGAVYVDKQTLNILSELQKRRQFTANGVASEFQIEVGPTREVLAHLEFQCLINKKG